MKEVLNIQVDKVTKDNLRIMAQEEGRSLANMVQTLINRAWIEFKKQAKEGKK